MSVALSIAEFLFALVLFEFRLSGTCLYDSLFTLWRTLQIDP